jgi:uncharacterized membrane protein YraQ (UPF0718 family)
LSLVGFGAGVAEVVTGGLCLLIIAATVIVISPDVVLWFSRPAIQAWRTIFVAIVVQALPFLVLGTVVSAAINAFVPTAVLARALPRKPALAVPVAGVAGVALPGCECASVPVAGSLMRRGVAPAVALTFLLSAPAVNPIVMVSTAVAFPNNPMMVLARLVASLAVAIAMGLLWVRFGRQEWLRLRPRPATFGAGTSRLEEFRLGMQHDFLHAGGFLVVGAIAAATFNVAVPRSLLDLLSESPWLSVLILAGLAIVLAICSEADAFVAASLTGFAPTALLTFMVVGPMVDVKLIALQAGTFGRAFAVRFSTATVVVAMICCVVVGGWLL